MSDVTWKKAGDGRVYDYATATQPLWIPRYTLAQLEEAVALAKAPVEKPIFRAGIWEFQKQDGVVMERHIDALGWYPANWNVSTAPADILRAILQARES